MQRVIVDTDTAGDDTQALALACLTDRLSVEAVTVVAGNVPFDREVENAKYALSLVDSTEVPVYEGARQPLLKEHEHAEEIHGEGGLGGDLHPETEIESADGFGPDEIVRRCRDAPGEITLLCIGPLTNLALAYAREPDLPDLVDEVWVMGGNVHCRGNVTPAAEFNFWVDPDAAKRVLAEFDATLVDWGLCLRDGAMGEAVLETIDGIDTDLADFFAAVIGTLRESGDAEIGVDGVTQPDALAAALLAYPELREATGTYHVDIDEREGLTRGYTFADVDGTTGEPADTRVIEAADADGFERVVLSMLRDRNPDAGVE
ncbi:nucleoside hydrolase [Halomicrobium urmianum]|uniref:nucleoside hydrolase n=1 Tax=Halomicrobium urmianum TaxID=1586233 RepID=UPI001CD975F4|nr:nucleoside hydrolase [Halomicrobium urmianum]